MRFLLPIGAIAVIALIAFFTLTGGDDQPVSPSKPGAPDPDGPEMPGPMDPPTPEAGEGPVEGEGSAGGGSNAEGGPVLVVSVVDDATGKPVAGASLRLLDRSRFKTSRRYSAPDREQFLMGIEVLDKGADLPGILATTGGDGVCRFEELEPGKYYLGVNAPDRAAGEVDGIAVPESGEESVEVRLAPGAAVEGLVLDGRRRAVAGARILGADFRRMTRVPYAPMMMTSSKPDGSFRLEGFRPGENTMVFARAPDGRIGIGVRIEAPKKDVEVLVGPRFTLSGQVLDDQTGEPVPGAVLYALLGYAEADESGRYVMEGAVKSAFFRYVWVQAEGYQEKAQQIDLGSAIFGGKSIEQDFRITKVVPGQVRVTVRDRDGQPVKGAAVLVKENRDGSVVARGITNATGEVLLEGIPPRGKDLEVLKPGHVQTVVATRRGKTQVRGMGPSYFNMRPGEEVALDVTLTRGGGASGIVRDEGGRPMAEVVVRSWVTELDKTNADGVFELKNLPAGLDVPLWFVKEGYLPEMREVVPGTDARLEVVLVPGGVLEGRVEDEAGKPLAGVDVMLLSDRFSQPRKTGADGAFRFEGIKEGEYGLQVSREGYPPRTIHPIAIGKGETKTGVSLRLVKGVEVTFKAFGPGGEPVAASITLVGPTEAGPEDQQFQQGGSRAGQPAKFHVLPGRHRILVIPDSESEGVGALDLHRDLAGPETVRLTLPGDPRRIRVRMPAGFEGQVSMQLQRTEPKDPPIFAWRSTMHGGLKDGVFSSPALLPGKYRVNLYYQLPNQDNWERREFKSLEPGGNPVPVE